MTRNFRPDVELAIEFGSNEIAKAVSDTYGAEYQHVRRNVRAMISAAVSSSCNDGWSLADDPWLHKTAADLNTNALDEALNQWWDGLDDKQRLEVIMGPAGHHKSEYLNNIKQKYQNKPEANLARDLPGLAKIYQQESGAGAPASTPTPAPSPSPTPAAAPAAPAPVAPAAPTPPAQSSLSTWASAGEAGFSTNAWIRIWVSSDELAEVGEIMSLRAVDESTDSKVEKAKEIARSVATDKLLSITSNSDIKIGADTLQLDASSDHIDWDELVSGKEEHDEVEPDVVDESEEIP